MRTRAIIKWKEKFLCLKEVILVLRKFETPDDSNRVSFELNIVVNHRLELRLESSFGKSHTVVRNSRVVDPHISLVVDGDREGLNTFEFEIFDVKR